MIYKLQKLPNVKEEDLEENNRICLICLNEIKSGKQIDCGHAFHYGCIRTWIEKNKNKDCPKCRRKINLDGKFQLKKKKSVKNKIKFNTNMKKEMFMELNKIKELSEHNSNLKIKQTMKKQQYQNEEQTSVFCFLNMKKVDKVDESQIGALPFTLPKEAVYYRTPQSELQRSKIQIANSILVEYYNKENFYKHSNILKTINKKIKLIEKQINGNSKNYQKIIQNPEIDNEVEEEIIVVKSQNSNQQNEIEETKLESLTPLEKRRSLMLAAIKRRSSQNEKLNEESKDKSFSDEDSQIIQRNPHN